jgi:5-methylcytosine-specific restriction endonuclease McrA
MEDPRYHTQRWRQLRARILLRDGKRCAIPNCRTDMSLPYAIHVDHIVETSDGGQFWDESNCQILCKKHHFAKTQDMGATRGEPVSPNA